MGVGGGGSGSSSGNGGGRSVEQLGRLTKRSRRSQQSWRSEQE